MYSFGQLCCVGYLCYLSVLDIQKRRLPEGLLAAGVGVAAAIAALRIFWGFGPFLLSLAGAAIGVGFLWISKITDEAFGYCPRAVSGALEAALSADGSIWVVGRIFHGHDEETKFSENDYTAVCPVFWSRIYRIAFGKAVLK